MNRLKKAALIGTVIAVLGAGAVGACRKDYDTTPTEPTRIASPTNTPVPTIEDIVTVTPDRPTATPSPTATPAINNSYDFAKSLGLEVAYLKDVAFDSNSKNLVSYLASLPLQMRSIAERSGMLEDILKDKQVDSKESVFFNRVIGSYQNEIKTMQPWLSQLSENEATAALALNLRNFREAGYLKNGRVPSLLSSALFFADGIKRMYAAEINNPDGWRSSPNKVYATTMVDNVTNFPEIQKKAWEVANDPNYKTTDGESIDHLLRQGYFEGEAVGSTDKGRNAYEDIKLLLEQGSPEAKAVLRLYARNLRRDGRQGSAPQVRVPLTMIDAWSLGIDSIGVVLAGHDVPTIPITDEDIALLKRRSQDPLLIVDSGGTHHLPLQWTRKSAVRSDVTTLTQVYVDRVGGIEYTIADLKPY